MVSTQLRKGVRPTLLTLPGEIRNRIYQYALSEQLSFILPSAKPPAQYVWMESGLAIQRPVLTMALYKDRPDVIEFNRLKFVCRQLHAETAGLELKYSDIIINRCYDFEDSVGEQFLQLSKHVSAKAHWLNDSTVTLQDTCQRLPQVHGGEFDRYFPDTARTIAKVADWCKDHPSVQIDVVLRGLRNFDHCAGCLESFMVFGVALVQVFRRQDLSDILPNGVDFKVFWIADVDMDEFRVPNLRWRVTPKEFDENAVKRQIDALAKMQPGWKDLIEEKWLEQTRRWVQEGF